MNLPSAKVLCFPRPHAVEAADIDDHSCVTVDEIAVDYATRRAIMFSAALGALFWSLLIAWLAA